MTEKRKEIGMLGEAMAVRFLKKRGYRILQQNFRCRMGEIDVVAQEEGNTVFVEVRTSTKTVFPNGRPSSNGTHNARGGFVFSVCLRIRLIWVVAIPFASKK